MDNNQKNPLLPEAEVTFCLIKPAAVYAGAVHEITTFLERNRFVMLAHKKLMLTPMVIREMYRETKIPDQAVQALQGSVVLLELTRKDAISVLRKLAGHDDPEHAPPGTLHYMYGANIFHNGVFVPKDKEEFDKLFEVLEVWFQVYSRAVTDQEAGPLDRAHDRFMAMMGQGAGKEVVEEEVEAAKEVSSEPALPASGLTERIANQYPEKEE